MTDKEITGKAVAKSLQYNTKYSEDFDLKKFLDNSDKGIQIDRLFHLLREKAYRDGYIAGAKDNTPQWHYIKDKDYPKCNELVIALDCKNEYAVLYYEDLKERGGTSWHTVERFTYARNIIAWQYLPEPPKEKKC